MRGRWLLLDVREQALSVVASEGVATGPEDDMGSDRIRERVDRSGGLGCPLVAVNADRREETGGCHVVACCAGVTPCAACSNVIDYSEVVP